MSYQDTQKEIIKAFNVNTIQEAREKYLSLSDQEKADTLYRYKIPGGVLGIAPAEYPKALPQLKPCKCGGKPAIETSYNGAQSDLVARMYCTKCGRRTKIHFYSPYILYTAWDEGEIDDTQEQLTLF